ncbi:MAG: 6-pyruvoyl tetrahydropterin synthase family protein [Candidatus Methylomirabilales bacterium]
MKLGIVDYIDCAHSLPGHPRCGRLHGHTYKVEVTISGEKTNGMVLDFAEMKRVVREVLNQWDHRSWNDFLEYPSVENICETISRGLAERLAFPISVRVWEGAGKWAEM